jgi:hypothetical protein
MATLYYKITAVNDLGESTETTGSYDPTLPTGGSVEVGGGTTLTFGTIADGQMVKRVGTQLVGASTVPPGPRSVTTVSANTTLLSSAQIVLVDTSSGDVTITLPSAAAAAEITIKNIGTATHQVIIDGSGAQTIDGSLTVELANGDRVTIVAITSTSKWESV